MNIIELENIKKVFKKGSVETVALNGVDLSVKEGEFTAVVGASGSGKTTLLNIIGILDTPTSGIYNFLDTRIEHTDTSIKNNFLDNIRAKYFGFIFQNYNLMNVLTALENVELAMASRDIPALEIRQQAEYFLERVGLSDRMHHRPNELSGGQQQRVSVARALMGHPKLVLADEPTANLDSKNTYQLIELMMQLNEELKMAFLFSTHDDRLLENIKNKITICDGRVF